MGYPQKGEIIMADEKVLIVDDDPDIRKLLTKVVEGNGFKSMTAASGQEAVALAQNRKFDLILLDIMMPKIDGYTVCEMIRRESNIPIIMLTAMEEEQAQVKAFELKADDYITKPFSLKLVLMRIEAVLRRVKEYEEKQKDIIQYRNIQLDSVSHTVYAEGTPVALTNIEYCLLELFLKNQGRVFTRDNLLNQVWGYDFVGDEKTVNIHIMNLRRKLGVDLIETIRGVGYRIGKEDKK